MTTQIAILLLVGVCIAAAPIYPVPDWAVDSPEKHGFDSKKLQIAADWAQRKDSYCLAIFRDGYLLAEWYWQGRHRNSTDINYSVSKSYSSALIGIAQDKGLLHINDKASKYISHWLSDPIASEVTIRDLLTMASGRHWDFVGDYVTPQSKPDQTAYAVDEKMDHRPQEWWEYNNMAVQTLEAILRNATGMDVVEFAKQNLFSKIGDVHSTWVRDLTGHPLMYMGVQSNCRDLARFGYLYLMNGTWANNEQVISKDFVLASTGVSTSLNVAYGYLWWLNNYGRYVLPSAPFRDTGVGLAEPHCPNTTGFAAMGAEGQFILVDRAKNVIITRHGFDTNASDPIARWLCDGLCEQIQNAFTGP